MPKPIKWTKQIPLDSEMQAVSLQGAQASIKKMLAEEVLSIGKDLTNDPNFLITLANSRRMAIFTAKWQAPLGKAMIKASVAMIDKHGTGAYEKSNKLFQKKIACYQAPMLAELRPILSAIEQEYRIEMNKVTEKTFHL